MQLKQTLKKLEEERISLNEKRNKLLPFLFIPPIIGLLVGINIAGPAIFFFMGAGIMLSLLLYHAIIGQDFKQIKSKLKSALVGEFMISYHPDIEFDYSMDKIDGRDIIKRSKLIGFDSSTEEDVLHGKMKDSNFYISEMKLSRKSDDSDVTVFKGIIFELKIPGKKFPQSEIQTNQSFWSKLTGQHKEHNEYNIYYGTSNENEFEKKIGPLLPFIDHLNKENKSIRIRADGDKLTIMMENKMKFMDEPRLSTNASFINQQYNANLAKQLNTLLFIVESFSNDLGESEVLEKLELKTLEILKANDLDENGNQK